MKIFNKIFLVLFLILNFSFLTFHSYSQWYAQTLPITPSGIYCLKFFNKNIGWLSTDGKLILKTTNGGNNWNIINSNLRMYSFQVFDSVTVYGVTRNGYYGSLFRTFDGGITWDSVFSQMFWTHNSIYFFNKDSGYIGSSDGNWGYIHKTTNGGVTLNQIYKHNASSFGEQMIFFKEKVNGEYYGYCVAGSVYMYKTTNSGYNWTQLTNGFCNNPSGYYFLNKDTGWVGNHDNFSNFMVQHTTNGGLNWVNQTSSVFFANAPYTPYFSSYNKGWAGTGSHRIYATTNGGQIWGRQITPSYITIWHSFIDSMNAWACGGGENIISHTTNGGGVIIGIQKDTLNNMPGAFTLKQNYPNPFNSSTIIEYSITKEATIGINIYDITGRSVYDMTANNQEPGNYRLKLDLGSLNLPSGIYFYKFLVVNKNMDRLYSETKKMMYVK